ncbi:MAG: bifunctional adenosylcobinamide kinase/adenosylcobinamide-phosphate guanylyltransferase [Candidatus Omnitrophota bacterium]
MKKVILVTGSVRSGKSSYAVNLAKATKAKVSFLATCQPQDAEMKKRVKKHKNSRPKSWKTIEEPIEISKVISKLKINEVLIIDCLTLWISNLLLSGLTEKEILKNIKEFVTVLKESKASIIIVSNEVGWGIVPDNKLARIFRDIIGTAHQIIAKVSDEVYLMIAGIPVRIVEGKESENAKYK